MFNDFADNFFLDTKNIISKIDYGVLKKMINGINYIKKNNGRIFFVGVGGSAANASHAINDFRKICNIECYAPTDNVSELTARINDEGWNTSYTNSLKISKLTKNDALFILSVGGGNKEFKISENIIDCIDFALGTGSKIFGIVGPDGGYTYEKGDLIIRIKASKQLMTPLTESFQSLILHLLVSSPDLKDNINKWEETL